MTNSKNNPASAGKNAETEELIAKGHKLPGEAAAKPAYTEDKRETARHEHTNHFTNRQPKE